MASAALYFYEQTSFRKTPKRYRKTPEELPHSLRFAHLNPKVAAYLANKEKEDKLLIDEQDVEDGSGDGKQSLLPQINARVNLIRLGLEGAQSGAGEDNSQNGFNEAKLSALSLLHQLTRCLYSFNKAPRLPYSLHHQLQLGYPEFTAEVEYQKREWQTDIAQQQWLQSQNQKSQDLTKSEVLSEQTLEDNDRLKLFEGGGDTKKGRVSYKHLSNDSTHTDMNDKDARKVKVCIVESSDYQNQSRAPSALSLRRESAGQNDRLSSADLKPKSRVDKFKSSFLDPRASADSGRRSSTLVSVRRGSAVPDDASQIPDNASDSGKSQAHNSYYMSVIQFQLSSKDCEEKGWIVHQGPKEGPEKVTLLEWATQRLRVSIKQKKEQDAVDKEFGNDRPVQIKYYGGSRKEQTKYGNRRSPVSRQPSSASKSERGGLKHSEDHGNGRKIFLTTTIDGTTTVFYPSGRIALVTSRNSPGKPGFYTNVYDNTKDVRMIASFTPAGVGCIYHDNGLGRLLTSLTGGSMYDTEGDCVKKWDWPPNHGKLATSIIFALNDNVTFRCVNQQQMYLYYNCQKEQAKFHVGLAITRRAIKEAEKQAEEDTQFQLVSGFSFTSNTAKELLRPAKEKRKVVKLRVKDRSSKDRIAKGQSQGTTAPEIQKILDFEDNTYGNQADKELARFRGKIRNLVDDWMEHYRIAVGISSPHIRNMKETPYHRRRNIHSAMPGTRGGRTAAALLSGESDEERNEDLALSYDRAAARKILQRAPSAPPATTMARQKVLMSHSAKPHSGKTEEEKDEEEDGRDSMSTPFCPSVISSIPMSMKWRGRKAHPDRPGSKTSPERTWSPPRGTCTIALRAEMMGEDRPTCKCSRHKVPFIQDLEYEEFIKFSVPEKQLIIVSVVSSLFPKANTADEMLESLHADRNRNRTRPCLQARNDPFRILKYDINTASEGSDHTTPLLLTRHNVIPGMFLIYEGGRLIFCDHIFNGYGNARKDFQKQMMKCRRDANLGKSLPQDFRFNPTKGRRGPRAAWGGEIGGAGVDRFGSAGLAHNGVASSLARKSSSASASSSDSYVDLPRPESGAKMETARQFLSFSLSSPAYASYVTKPASAAISRSPATLLTPPAPQSAHARLFNRHAPETVQT